MTASDDLASFGAPKELCEELDPVKDDYFVFEENWETVQCFLRLGTQWNVSQVGVSGLNYQSIESIFRLMKVEKTEDVFDGIQIMEFEALKIFEARAKDGKRK